MFHALCHLSGRECIILFENYESILKLAYVGKDETALANSLALWKAFKDVFQAIMDVDDDQDLEAQAQQVHELAFKFGNLFQTTLAGASGGVYLHILVSFFSN